MEIVDKVIPEHGFSNGETIGSSEGRNWEELRFYKRALSMNNAPTFS